MLNLIMTHSPRLAAMSTNKQLGEDALGSHETRHRLAWLQRSRGTNPPASAHSVEHALRERTA